ncbi:hypothetical protein [Cellvibrio sp. PSBB023]|uniref:hypothetical protein n=1 Tax=Cellvibrio sp. PSBB023 TaxID=1945512 RepID=UPI0009901B2A|nr:hypothetical protein [Cellvibrio sp. PSBB023]AQT61638.1 hypothetical protein B0D95_17120 [Cellvibrio sp. PSBB023]
MKLNNKKLYEFLKGKKVLKLFHANTVATSMTYIEEGGLLSRKAVEDRELYQTPQTSDEIDKLFDVFGDVFLDTKDLHSYFSRQNHYGPVLFQFGLELVRDERFEVWVTKDNPIYWKSNSIPSDNYFRSVEELAENWDRYDVQKKMFTIRKPSQAILFDYLESITLDNPKVRIDDVSLRKESRKALEEATKGDFDIRKKLIWRECGYCFCSKNYLNQVPVPELTQKFLPVYHAEFEE